MTCFPTSPQAIQSELSDLHVAGVLDECQRLATELTSLTGTPGKVEVQKYMEDLDSILEEIEDAMKDREEELDTALGKAQKYDQTLQVSGEMCGSGEGAMFVLTVMHNIDIYEIILLQG